jgi:hypothetical protein
LDAQERLADAPVWRGSGLVSICCSHHRMIKQLQRISQSQQRRAPYHQSSANLLHLLHDLIEADRCVTYTVLCTQISIDRAIPVDIIWHQRTQHRDCNTVEVASHVHIVSSRLTTYCSSPWCNIFFHMAHTKLNFEAPQRCILSAQAGGQKLV